MKKQVGYFNDNSIFKRTIRILLKCLIALCIAFFLLNMLSFFYYRPVGWIERTDSATNAIWNPGKVIIQNEEGMGVYKVDHNGYLNPNKPLGDGYTLVVGASFVAGLQVKNGERYTDILNRKLAGSDDELIVYNCAQDNFLLTDIIQGFYAIIQEFPDAKNIVLDVGTSDFSDKEIQESMNQHGFDEMQLGRNIVSTLPFEKRIIMKVKESFPVLSVLNKQIQDSIRTPIDSGVNIDIQAYSSVMNDALELIRSEYNGNLIILYHPAVQIERDGSMTLIQSKTYNVFANLCQQNGIVFVDMSEPFLKAYEKEYVVPYGFINTSIGKGHFSMAGHQMIADELYQVINGLF